MDLIPVSDTTTPSLFKRAHYVKDVTDLLGDDEDFDALVNTWNWKVPFDLSCEWLHSKIKQGFYTDLTPQECVEKINKDYDDLVALADRKVIIQPPEC